MYFLKPETDLTDSVFLNSVHAIPFVTVPCFKDSSHLIKSPKHVLAKALEGHSVYQALQSAMNDTFCLDSHDEKTRCLK